MDTASTPWPSLTALRWKLIRHRLRQAVRRSAAARWKRRLGDAPWLPLPAAAPPGAGVGPDLPDLRAAPLGASADDVLILFHNRMWGQPPGFNPDDIPPGVTFSWDRRRFAEADAVVFHLPELPPRAFRRLTKPPGQLWVAWSFESTAAYPWLDDPWFMRRFDLRMTYRQEAEVFMPYLCFYGPDLLTRLRQPPPPNRSGAGTEAPQCLFLASHDRETSGRTLYVRQLMRHLEVHSYGRCLNTHPFADDDGSARAKDDLLAGYKFTLAFENARAVDYVTEKFFSPLIMGSVPVYLGAPNVADFAPGDHCYIDVRSFRSPQDLAAYLRYLDGNDPAYGEYLAWKGRPFRPDFVDMVERTKEDALIRLARIVQARRG